MKHHLLWLLSLVTCMGLATTAMAQNCVPSFTYQPSVVGNTVNFQAIAPPNAPQSGQYYWRIDDYSTTGQTYTPVGSNVTVQFAGVSSFGYHYACVTYIDSLTGCSGTFCDSIFVSSGQQPCNVNVSFTYYTDTTNGQTVLTANPVGFNGPVSYSWSFGATGQTATASLSQGWHGICVTAMDSLCMVTSCDSVYVGNPMGGGCNAHPVQLDITFDNYANEVSWDIVDVSGMIVASGGNYSSAQNGSTINLPACLATGCYTLTLYDSWGDGLCCAYGLGSYQLVDAATGVILASGGSYGAQDVTTFCLGGASAPCLGYQNASIQHSTNNSGDLSLWVNLASNQQPYYYNWFITDGINGYSATSANPTFTSLNSGTYSVSLVVMDSLCLDSLLYTVNVINNNSGNSCAGIIPGMNVYQDSTNPYLLYIVPTLANVPPNYNFQFYWQFGNNTYSGIPAHNFGTAGTYQVCYHAYDSLRQCSVSYCDTITLDTSGNFSRFVANKWQAQVLPPVITNITEVHQVTDAAWNLELFPNPAQEQLQVRLATTEALDATLTILDVTGQVVHQQPLQQAAATTTTMLSIEQLPAGVYFLQVVGEQEQATMRFIKQ